MDEIVLLGRGTDIISIPESVHNKHLEKVPEHGRKRLAFMTPDHHRVRYFVVRELPRFGRPVTVHDIATRLSLAVQRVETILAELEENLYFLVRNEHGAVHWAFPVTVEPTAHAIRFSSGETLYGA
jgi:hypothetical protein